jgi:polyhydroxyalkanoate synthase
VSLKTITVPAFVTGAVTDHLTPWKGCYWTTQLLSGPSTFVLSYSGHIASLVNPPAWSTHRATLRRTTGLRPARR